MILSVAVQDIIVLFLQKAPTLTPVYGIEFHFLVIINIFDAVDRTNVKL
jgi:hypothetical protein